MNHHGAAFSGLRHVFIMLSAAAGHSAFDVSVQKPYRLI
jgi:hypothetical protein